MTLKTLSALINLLRSLCIVAGLMGTLTIIVLSLVPGTLRPHTGAGGDAEHWLAYAMVALSFGLGSRRGQTYLMTGTLMSAGSGLLELAQNFVPGRNAGLAGFIASSLGAWIGLGIAVALLAFFGLFVKTGQASPAASVQRPVPATADDNT